LFEFKWESPPGFRVVMVFTSPSACYERGINESPLDVIAYARGEFLYACTGKDDNRFP
jgi:hypothetical protein